VTDKDLWRAIPAETTDPRSSSETSVEVADIIEKYGL